MTRTPDPWRAEVRRQAYVAVQIAAARREAAEETLAYYLRRALAHGLSVADVCQAGDLERDEVMRLTDPARAA